MKIIIAMATYNGEAFLSDQLQSFADQTVLPDQIVISDDRSTDNTLEIVEDFRSRTSISIKVTTNKKTRGVANNFHNALEHAHGDIILLSDQDDVWLPTKVELYLKFFDENPNIHLVLSDAYIFHKNFESNRRTKLEYFKERNYSFNYFCTGCCMGFRQSFLDFALPIPSSNYAHDVWLNDIGLALDSRFVLDTPSMCYRRHSSNASKHISSSISRIGFVKEFLQRVRAQREFEADQGLTHKSAILMKHFYSLNKQKPQLFRDFNSVIDKLRVKHKKNLERDSLRKYNFIKRTFISLRIYFRGGYRMYNGVRSLIRDIFFP